MLLSDLAARLGLRLRGVDRAFTGLNTLEAAGETEVSFLANPKYAHFLATTRACAVIVSHDFADRVATALPSGNPYRDFARAAAFFVRPPGEFSGVSDRAFIHPAACLAENCTVYPFVHVSARARIGDGCTLFPGSYVGEDSVLGRGCVLCPDAVVLAGVELGEECRVQSGAVLGTDGFGFVRADGMMRKIPQIGTVRLADGVDVGANSCIDRSTLGATSVGKDSKLDNLVQIGHNVSLGEQCLIISQVGIAGSTKVGDRTTMAGQAGIAGHLTIGDDVTIGPQAGVAADIPSGVSGSGSPFMERGVFLRAAVLAPRLPELHRRVRQLEKELNALRALLADLSGKERT